MFSLKAEACELGADALVVVNAKDSNYWKLYANSRGKAEGVAIKLLQQHELGALRGARAAPEAY